MTGPTRSKPALYASVGLIGLAWVGFTVQQVFSRPLPQNVFDLFLRKSGEAGIVLVVVWLLMRLNHQSVSSLGFRFGLGRDLLVYGLLLPAGLFLVANVILNTFLATVLGTGATATLRALFRDPSQAPWWVLTAIIGGGFAEELQRAFVLTRFEEAWGKAGLITAVIVDSVVFGLRHLYQGPHSAIAAGFTGLMFALVFLRRRQVVQAMVAHASYDLIGITVAYALYGV